MERRTFLKSSALGFTTLAGGRFLEACAVSEPAPAGTFGLGVASGLHSASEVVLWTRVDPRVSSAGSVNWELATDPAMNTIVASGSALVSPATDHCVKVLVGGLQSDRSYWYRFIDGAAHSPIGRARTLPGLLSATSECKLAFATCQHYSAGFYTAWRQIAQTDVDAVLFLGDYIYERGLGPLGVRDEPFDEDKTIDNYRLRYRVYKSDPDLQAAHAAHPFVVIWDDHEVFNDHDRDLLDADPVRAHAAHQTWFDYLPVWPIDQFQIYRSLNWGTLAQLMVTDSRQYRDGHFSWGTPLGGFLDANHANPSRTQLGLTQRQWLLDELSAAQANNITWKLLGNQTMIAPIRFVDLDEAIYREADPTLPKHAGFYSLMDSWDGFPAERDLILAHIADHNIDNVNVLTGDVHAFFQANVRKDFDDESSPIVCNEWTVSSISSPSFAYAESLVTSLNGGTLVTHPTFNYVDLSHNGYATLHATPAAMTVTYHACDARSGTTPVPAAQWTVTAGDPIATRLF